MCAKTIRATKVEEMVGSSSSGSSASASVSSSERPELLPAPQPASARMPSSATTTPSQRLPTRVHVPAGSLVNQARGQPSRSSPARIASAASSRCSCSTVSGGESATAPSSGRTSTPASRAPCGHARRAPALLDRLGRERDRAQQAEAGTHLRHRRVLGQRRQRVAQRAFELAPALDQPVALVDVQDGHRHRAARRVAGVGRAVAQHRAGVALEERRGDRRRRRPRRRAAGSRR